MTTSSGHPAYDCGGAFKHTGCNCEPAKADRARPEIGGNAATALLTETPLPPAPPLTPRDVETLVDYKGDLQYGYDESKINSLFGRLESVRFECAWDYYDEYGYGGDSDFAGRPMGSRASGPLGVGRAVPDPKGPFRRMHPEAWEYLSDPDSDIDPERIPSLLSDELFERQDLDELAGDGFHNVAFEDTRDEGDEETCAAEDCGEDLSDGEGWDGYCGTHADLIEQHGEGEHRGEGARPDDCPRC